MVTSIFFSVSPWTPQKSSRCYVSGGKNYRLSGKPCFCNTNPSSDPYNIWLLPLFNRATKISKAIRNTLTLISRLKCSYSNWLLVGLMYIWVCASVWVSFLREWGLRMVQECSTSLTTQLSKREKAYYLSSLMLRMALITWSSSTTN